VCGMDSSNCGEPVTCWSQQREGGDRLHQQDARSAPAADGQRTGVNRRDFLRAGALGVGAVALTGIGLPAAVARADTSTGDHDRAPLELILLGTRGGLPPSADRAGIASVLVVDGVAYMIDCGYAAALQFARAGLPRQSLGAIFVTHLHADHVADYYNMIMLGAVTGLPWLDQNPAHVPVYGPGPAGGLPRPFGGGTAATVNPDDPTPGIRQLTDSCHAAYAYSSNIFMRDAGMRDIRTLVDPHEIAIPHVGASPTGQTAPPMNPFPVMEDDRVAVTAILVPHGPVFPSFAFRFDTDHGSVTFSGDTKLSQNVITLARGSDILVHEAISDPTAIGLPPAIRDHMLQSHTLVDEVGQVAQAAGAKHLVLSHIGDFTGPVHVPTWRRLAQQGFDGKVTIGEDLARIVV
jgi:ribonuclease BN (tRNA processing enzyme)